MKVIVGTTFDAREKESSRYTDSFSAKLGSGEGHCFAYFSAEPPDPSLLSVFHNIKAQLAEFARTAPKDIKALEGRFERMITSLNEYLLEEFDDLERKKSFHMAVGAAAGLSLFLTGAGSLYATFMRPDKSDAFHVYELFPKISETETDGEEKIFGAMVSGELQPGDILGIAHAHTVHVLGEKEWKRIIAEGRAGASAAKIRGRLNELEQEGGAVILNFEGGDREDAVAISRSGIDTLKETAERTQKILESAIAPALISGARSVGRTAVKLLNHGSRGILRGLRRAAKSSGRINLPGVGNPSHIIHSASAGTVNRPRRPLAGDLTAAVRRLGDASIDRFNALPRFAKLLSVLLLAVAIIFLQSIIFLGFRRNLEAEEASYRTVVEEIKNLKYEADASIIYEDEKKARELLHSARERALALPQNSRGRRREAGDLLVFIDESIEKLRREVQVTGEIVQEEVGREYAVLSLYKDGAPRAVSVTSDRAIIIDGDGKFYEIAPNGERSALKVDLPDIEAADIEIFGTRLYVLAPRAPQIYRLNRAGSGFGAPAAWVTQGSDYLRGSKAMAVDGAIYVLASDAVHKFFTGAREEWSPYIEPPLEAAEKIWTSDEARGVYIMEPARRRIIVLSKQGDLLAQYIFPEGSDLKDFAVEKGEESLLAANADRVERINLNYADLP